MIFAGSVALVGIALLLFSFLNNSPPAPNSASKPGRMSPSVSIRERLAAAAPRHVARTQRAPGARPPTQAPKEGKRSAPKAVANELIVTLKPGTKIDGLAAQLGARVLGRMDHFHTYRLQFGDDSATAAAREKIEINPQVAAVDLNYLIVSPPAGEMLPSSPSSVLDLKVKPGPSDGRIVVGLIDSAVQLQGPGMDGFLLPPISASDGSVPDPNVLTHGTSMAETILQGLSTLQGTATTSSVRILPVDVYGDSLTTSSWQVADGILKAVEGGATIINLSLGSDGNSSLLQTVIQDAHAQGISFFGAAGNEALTTPTYPAAWPEVVAVTSLDQSGNVSAFANYGDFVDVGAPASTTVNFQGQSYLATGTSVSTAFISGLAAGFAEKKQATAVQAEEAIRKTLAVQPQEQ